MDKLRLQKYLADCGVASRRGAEALITAGRVLINGQAAKPGDHVCPGRDLVQVDGRHIRFKRLAFTYLAFYKPRGVVTTMQDELGRPCISDYVKELSARVFPVGRLDRDSEGLVLLTDDGALANRMMHPGAHIPKTYRVTVGSHMDADMLMALRGGVKLDDGYVTMPADVEVRDAEESRTVLRITLYEGKNRQIRRMCEALGVSVLLLKRESVGPVRLSRLKPGQMRHLSAAEIEQLILILA